MELVPTTSSTNSPTIPTSPTTSTTTTTTTTTSTTYPETLTDSSLAIMVPTEASGSSESKKVVSTGKRKASMTGSGSVPGALKYETCAFAPVVPNCRLGQIPQKKDRQVRSHQERGTCWPESTLMEKKGHAKPKMCPVCGIHCADGKEVHAHYQNYHNGTKKIKKQVAQLLDIRASKEAEGDTNTWYLDAKDIADLDPSNFVAVIKNTVPEDSDEDTHDVVQITQSPAKPNLFRCPFCDKQYQSKGARNTHIHNAMKDEVYHLCSQPDYQIVHDRASVLMWFKENVDHSTVSLERRQKFQFNTSTNLALVYELHQMTKRNPYPE